MNPTQSQIREVEISIEQAKRIIERGRAARRLADNPDFKALVLEGYLRDEAARLADLLSEPALRDQDRAGVARDINGPGALRRFFQNILREAQMAEESMASDEMTLDELRAEEIEGTAQ